jgi:long-chain acyl-CoA synthetase
MLKEMARKDISVYLGVPSMYRFFLETRVDSPPDLSHIRYLLSCTAPLDPQVVEAFHRKFNATICQHYGSSETGGATTHVPSEVLSHSESVGRAMPGVRIRTLDADGNVQPAGAEGEVVVESPAVARKYLMGQEVEPSPLQDGRYLTGDIGRIDKDGYLYVTGRKDKLINVGGLKVSPEEVVRVLESCPAVREAAVTGIREDNNEEIVFAAVTLRSAADENDILEYCHGRLAEYKIPRRIDIREELPRSATGKIRLRPEDMKL